MEKILKDEQDINNIRKLVVECYEKDSINLRRKLLWSYNLQTLQMCIDRYIKRSEEQNLNVVEFKEWAIFFLMDAVTLNREKPKTFNKLGL